MTLGSWMIRNQNKVILALGWLLICIYVIALNDVTKEPEIDIKALEKEVEQDGHPVREVTYEEYKRFYHDWEKEASEKVNAHALKDDPSYRRTLRYHKIWEWTNEQINRFELFKESPQIDAVLEAMQTAQIVHIDILDWDDYEKGTSEKWVATLEGGAKAMMKLKWEKTGTMKKGGLCNYGYEWPSSEIAAFHLHRVLGFRNTPYVVGRMVNLRTEVMPVASTAVAKQLSITADNKTCVQGKCFFCKKPTKLCPADGMMAVSLSYWVPRHLRLYTYPPKYMPWSTPNRKAFEKYGFNQKGYCDKLKSGFHPYEYNWYYLDLFDFAVLDTLMYHFDTKHYIIYDDSEAQGLTVLLDHGRTFCNYAKDDYDIFLVPLIQCCKLRKTTWDKIKALPGDTLTTRLKELLDKDPLAPILDQKWYPVLLRRLAKIRETIEKCAQANGGMEHVLVED